MTTGNESMDKFCEQVTHGEWCANRASYAVDLSNDAHHLFTGYVCDRHLQDLIRRYELVPSGFNRAKYKVITELI
jgi:hypothetical protein